MDDVSTSEISADSDRTVVTSEPDGTRHAHPNWVLAVLTAAYICSYLDRDLLSMLVEPIKRDLVLTDTQMGLLSGTAFAIFYVTSGVFVGALADIWSRRLIIGTCLFIWSATTALTGVTSSFGQFFAARLGVGLGESGCVPAAQSLIANYFPARRRAAALGIFTAGSAIGTVLGFLLGGWINEWFNWRTAFFVASIPGIVIGVLVFATVGEPQRKTALGATHEETSLASIATRIRGATVFLVAKRSFRYLALATALIMIVQYGIATFAASLFIRHHHLGSGQVGIVLAIAFGFAGGIGLVLGGRVGDRLARRNPAGYLQFAAVATGVSVPLYWGWAFCGTSATASCLLAAAAFAGNAAFGPLFAALHGIVQPSRRALGVSVLMFSSCIVGIGLGPLLGGGLSDVLATWFGAESLRVALAAIGALGLPAAAGFVAASRSLQHDWEESGS